VSFPIVERWKKKKADGKSVLGTIPKKSGSNLKLETKKGEITSSGADWGGRKCLHPETRKGRKLKEIGEETILHWHQQIENRLRHPGHACRKGKKKGREGVFLSYSLSRKVEKEDGSSVCSGRTSRSSYLTGVREEEKGTCPVYSLVPVIRKKEGGSEVVVAHARAPSREKKNRGGGGAAEKEKEGEDRPVQSSLSRL